MPVGRARSRPQQVLCSKFFSSFTFIKLTDIKSFYIFFLQPYFLNIYKKSVETKKMSFNFGLDHDPVVICPYDKNHRIARSRIQRHLVKCEKNFPPGFKKQCPYDATHRVFEHELIEHIKNCPMKHSCPNDLGQTHRYASSEVTMQQEHQFDDEEETWDEDLPDDSITNDPEQKFLHSSKQNSDMFVIKRYSGRLRPPYGYSESLMLETSNTDIDEDAPSVTSDMGIGRGRIIPLAHNGQYKRGMTVRKGIRGRLLP